MSKVGIDSILDTTSGEIGILAIGEMDRRTLRSQAVQDIADAFYNAIELGAFPPEDGALEELEELMRQVELFSKALLKHGDPTEAAQSLSQSL